MLLQKALLQNILDLKIAGMELVDTSRAEWRQILDFRNDTDSQEKLRNFRLFFFDNYRDKPTSYIRDDIERKIYEHKKACKKHDLKTITSSLSILCNSKSLAVVVSLVTVCGLMGLPFDALTPALLAEATIEIGKIAINVAEKRADINEISDSHPLAYVISARKALEKGTES
jgi:hypothetical protein